MLSSRSRLSLTNHYPVPLYDSSCSHSISPPEGHGLLVKVCLHCQNLSHFPQVFILLVHPTKSSISISTTVSSYSEKTLSESIRSRRSSPNLSITIPTSFTPPTQQPHIVVSCSRHPKIKREADHEEFSWRLWISFSPQPHHNNSHCKSPKLFDPHHLIPMRRSGGTEDYPFDGGEKENRIGIETYGIENPPMPPGATRFDSFLIIAKITLPVRFSVLAHPQTAQQSQTQIAVVLNGTTVPSTTSKHLSNDHISASSTSFYAVSLSSSAFTLS
jgi:protein SMG6